MSQGIGLIEAIAAMAIVSLVGTATMAASARGTASSRQFRDALDTIQRADFVMRELAADPSLLSQCDQTGQYTSSGVTVRCQREADQRLVRLSALADSGARALLETLVRNSEE